jgi:hypothetical protein
MALTPARWRRKPSASSRSPPTKPPPWKNTISVSRLRRRRGVQARRQRTFGARHFELAHLQLRQFDARRLIAPHLASVLLARSPSNRFMSQCIKTAAFGVRGLRIGRYRRCRPAIARCRASATVARVESVPIFHDTSFPFRLPQF